MTLHQTHHEMLYKSLREIITDYISTVGKTPTTIIELSDWAKAQIKHDKDDVLNANSQQHLKV